jgi:perosamine synthetase
MPRSSSNSARPDSLPQALLNVYTTRCAGGDGSGLERILPPGRTRYFGYGRQALAEAIRSAGCGTGDDILVPGFICAEALASLAATGSIPRFYEVDDMLRVRMPASDDPASRNVRAVIVVNYFGFPQPLDAVREWCQGHNAVLIEDNAHGFLSEEGNSPLGRRGDLGVFSIRKTLAIPNGAALVDNRPGCERTPTDGTHEALPGLEGYFRIKTLVKRFIGCTGPAGAHLTISAIRAARFLGETIRGSFGGRHLESGVPGVAVAPLTMQLLRQCNLDLERLRRRRLFEECQAVFSGVPGVRPIFDKLPEGAVPQGFPLLCLEEDRASFIREWWHRGVQILSWPDHLPDQIAASPLPTHYRRVMLVPFLW